MYELNEYGAYLKESDETGNNNIQSELVTFPGNIAVVENTDETVENTDETVENTDETVEVEEN